MAAKYRTKDGYSVEVVQLADTSGNHDGEWLRIRYHGYHVADVRSIAELERYIPLGELEPDALTRPANAAWAARGRAAHAHEHLAISSPGCRAPCSRGRTGP
jgi:hypothetical protein